MDAEAWDERYAATELVWSQGPNEFVERELADLEPGRALDLAAGEGRNAIWLASRGWQVTAVDFSQVGLDKGRQLAGDVDVEWLRGDATTWSRTWSREAAYDVCVLAYLQLPAADRRAANRHAFASLAPGGTFLLVAHDTTNLTEGTGGPQDVSVLMTADDVLGDLVGEPFEVEHAGRVPRLVGDGHGEDPQRSAWDCLVRLRRTPESCA